MEGNFSKKNGITDNAVAKKITRARTAKTMGFGNIVFAARYCRNAKLRCVPIYKICNLRVYNMGLLIRVKNTI